MICFAQLKASESVIGAVGWPSMASRRSGSVAQARMEGQAQSVQTNPVQSRGFIKPANHRSLCNTHKEESGYRKVAGRRIRVYHMICFRLLFSKGNSPPLSSSPRAFSSCSILRAPPSLPWCRLFQGWRKTEQRQEQLNSFFSCLGTIAGVGEGLECSLG